MDEKEFEHKLENDGGRYLLQSCYKKLTKEQKDIAFDNAINNNEGWYLLKIFYEKLTAKKRKIAKYCDENLKEKQILSSLKTCIKILLGD